MKLYKVNAGSDTQFVAATDLISAASKIQFEHHKRVSFEVACHSYNPRLTTYEFKKEFGPPIEYVLASEEQIARRLHGYPEHTCVEIPERAII